MAEDKLDARDLEVLRNMVKRRVRAMERRAPSIHTGGRDAQAYALNKMRELGDKLERMTLND